MKSLSTHKITLLYGILALVVGLGFAPCPGIAAEPGVHVQSEAWVKGDEVHLGDIAVISGLDELSEEVAMIYVGRAPAAGKRRAVRGAMILSKLNRMALPAHAVVEVPSRIKIHRLSQKVDEQDLKAILADFLAQRLYGGRFEISRFQVNGNGPIPEGILDITLQESRDDKIYGQINLRAVISVDGKVERRVSMAAWVDFEAPVVMATRNLKRLDVLSQSDVEVGMANVSRLPNGVISDPASVQGMRIRQGVEGGKVLYARMLEKPPLVERGDDVTITASSNSMSITTLGQAKESGGLGDRINVENLMSKKLITCRVTGPAKVEVRF